MKSTELELRNSLEKLGQKYNNIPEVQEFVIAFKEYISTHSHTDDGVTWTRSEISSLIQKLGIPCHLLGFTYIVTAIQILQEKTDFLSKITTSLYPEVAKEYNTTASRVERSIRTAVNYTSKNKVTEIYSELFPSSIGYENFTPSNSKFLATVLEYIRNHS